MSTFTLDEIREAAEAKYGSTVIPLPGGIEVKLLNPIRLSKEKRAELMRIQGEMNSLAESAEGASDEDAIDTTEAQFDLLARAIRTVCETQRQADALLAKIGHDGGQLLTVFERYNKSEAPGEA